MTFVLQRVTPRGSVLTQIRTDALRIGRGTNAELRSENPAVALEHAVIESGADGYVVVDRGSITGTYVNGKPVESARLAKVWCWVGFGIGALVGIIYAILGFAGAFSNAH